MSVSLPSDKIALVIDKGKALLKPASVKVLDLASYVGILVTCFPAVTYGPMHYRALEKHKSAVVASNFWPFGGYTVLSSHARAEIIWWIDHASTAKKTIVIPDPRVFISTGASLLGWGPLCQILVRGGGGGRWSDQESLFHINTPEILALLLGIKSLLGHRHDIHVRCQIDNTTSVAYVNHIRGV